MEVSGQLQPRGKTVPTEQEAACPQSRPGRCREEQNVCPNRELNIDSTFVHHGAHTDVYCLLGYAVMQTDTSLPTFRRNMLPPSSW
jgi:hypothetical protein